MGLGLTLGLLLVGAAGLGQTGGTCTTSAGQFGQQFITCRRGDLVCQVESHGGDAYREFFARSGCVRLAPPPTPTAAEILRQQEGGPPIPGRGGPRWENDDGR